MFLSNINKLADNGKDYALLIDYGSEGISIHSQHETIAEAIEANSKEAHIFGAPMAIVKICRINEPTETN